MPEPAPSGSGRWIPRKRLGGHGFRPRGSCLRRRIADRGEIGKFGGRDGRISRILSRIANDPRTAISLGRRLLAASCGLPGSSGGPGRPARRAPEDDDAPPLFGLAPGGVYRAEGVAPPAGELLPHRFTLTPRAVERPERRSVFCGTVPTRSKPDGGRYPPPRPAKSGLSSPGRVVPFRQRKNPRRPSRPPRPLILYTEGSSSSKSDRLGIEFSYPIFPDFPIGL